MARRSPYSDATTAELLATVVDRLRPPFVVVLGSPHQAALLSAALGNEVVCYQLDLYQAGRLREELSALGSKARVVTGADLWDLSADFNTVVYPAQHGSERGLKLDMIEQAFHVLRPHGTFAVLSDYPEDQFFPGQLKKVFGRVHTPAAGRGQVLLCHRDGDRPRRRHEVTFHARIGEGPSLHFLSRPGVFSYGRFDDGARALMQAVLDHGVLAPGAHILDVGCGCGTNGCFAGRWAGAEGNVVFVDSNVRAVGLAEQNARANELANFRAVASCDLEGLPARSFDLVLANPPYYAQHAIAELFIAGARPLLKRGGHLYLVTRQPDNVAPLLADAFGEAEMEERRGYIVMWNAD